MPDEVIVRRMSNKKLNKEIKEQQLLLLKNKNIISNIAIKEKASNVFYIKARAYQNGG